MVEKILNNTTPYGKIRASHEGSLPSSTLNVLGQTQSGNPSPTFHTHTPLNAQLYDAGVVEVSQKLARKYTVPTGSRTRVL